MTTNKQLRELAEGAAHWSGSLAHVWPSDPDFNDAWAVGTIDEDGNKYPVIEVDADQYDAPGDSERLARFFTAANPATVLTLLDAYEALQAECEKLRNGLKNARYRIEQGRIWNGMGWSLTGLHAYQQQRALDEIDAAMQADNPC